ncbi:ABC transporter ATP-binding protein [Microbacterium istanbulense]|uniref:ABC transporter ATP-binding protein n=1 Tax=Microbacterium istanbulense TaxID=3122049 RepID=A0ABU8LJE4_9MICO
MSGIVARGVGRSFGSVHAVSDATFEAPAGKITGLVGPNGAGKTTLLLMLASLLAPDRGEIRIGDVDPIAAPRDARRLLGWMPDALGAWPSLTARESIVTTARLHDMSVAEATTRADELLRLVGLDDLAGSPARVLSRGQKQKLGLARALVHNPQVLLLDEPASGLDPEARVQLRVLLRRLADEGCTVLISSHVLAELEEVIDGAVFLVAGSVVDPGAAPAGRTYRVRLAAAQEAGAEVSAPSAAALIVSTALGLDPAQVASDRGDAIVHFVDDHAAVDALRRLVAAGAPVLEFAPAQSALESTFMSLRHPSPSEGSAS